VSIRWSRTVVLVLWLAVLATSAGVVYVSYGGRMQFAELDRQIAERDRLNIEWNRLQLEQGTYTTPGFVEQVAINKLHMAAPVPAEIRLVPK
jgi:cell division protein FtsL